MSVCLSDHGTARSVHAMSILWKIFWIITCHNIRLRAVWIPSEANVTTDAGSRFNFPRLEAATSIPRSSLILSGPIPTSPSSPPVSEHVDPRRLRREMLLLFKI